jgi:catechol 2,3-dioxygenase-like lactoylglutathione lyase family enzyme
MRIEHVNVRCTRLATTADFLCSAVGLRPGPRPDFAFPGQWLYDDLPAQMGHLQQLGHATPIGRGSP